MRRIDGVEALRSLVGAELGVSPWRLIDQELIDRFADVTDDRQWIHTDPERAASGVFGGTVAHGLLTLSLIPAMAAQTFEITGAAGRINYGYDRVRFPSPVRAGSRIRDRIMVSGVEEAAGGVRVRLTHTVEVESSDRPACIAEGITLLVTGSASHQGDALAHDE